MASREQNEAVAGLLRRSLGHTAAAEPCPESDLLAAYFEKSLAPDETARFDRHVSACSRCREQLAAMVRAEPPKAEPNTFWLFDWRLLSAAAMLMVIATLWFVGRHDRLVQVAQNGAPSPAVSNEAANKDAAAPSEAGATAAPNAVPQQSLADSKTRRVVPAPPRIAPAAGALFGQSLDQKNATDSASISGDHELAGPKPSSVNPSPSFPEAASSQKARGSASGGTGYGFSVRQSARAGHLAAGQQQERQQRPQMGTLSEAATVPTGESAAPPSQENSSNQPSNIGLGSANGLAQAAPTPGNSDDTAAPASRKKQAAEAVSTSLLDQSAQVQILEERSDKLIATPIPSIKWRITAAGFVERSEDGGLTWNGQEPDPSAHLLAGSAPTEKVCWLVGKEGVVLVTKDAANWKKIPPPVAADLTAVSAKSASAATVTTADGHKYSTRNEGKKWKPAD